MSRDEIYQRLAAISLKLEEHDAAAWILRQEQTELRGELRRLNASAPGHHSGDAGLVGRYHEHLVHGHDNPSPIQTPLGS